MLCIRYTGDDTAVARQDFAYPLQRTPRILQVLETIPEDPAITVTLIREELVIGLFDIERQGLIAMPSGQHCIVLINIYSEIVTARIDLFEFPGKRAYAASDIDQSAGRRRDQTEQVRIMSFGSWRLIHLIIDSISPGICETTDAVDQTKKRRNCHYTYPTLRRFANHHIAHSAAGSQDLYLEGAVRLPLAGLDRPVSHRVSLTGARPAVRYGPGIRVRMSAPRRTPEAGCIFRVTV
jgi:hypothetical protein